MFFLINQQWSHKTLLQEVVDFPACKTITAQKINTYMQ